MRHGAVLLGSTVFGTGAETKEVQLQVPRFEGPCGWGTSDPSLGRLCDWLRDECRATGMENVFIGMFEHGETAIRGSGARKAFQEGELAYCIPKKCWFGKHPLPEHIKRLSGPEGSPGEGSDCSANELIAISMAEERALGSKSRWFPYMSVLPTEEEYKGYHPAYFEVDENAKYNSSWTEWTAGLPACYAKYKDMVGETAVPYNEVYLDLVHFLSRRFGTVDLVPLGDMLNSDSDDKVNVVPAYKDGDMETFCLKVVQPIEPGQELLVDYGLQGHDALTAFELWGFWLDPIFHQPMGTALGVPPEKACSGLTPQEVFAWPWKTDRTSQLYRTFSEVHCHEPDDKRRRQSRLRRMRAHLASVREKFAEVQEELRSLKTIMAAISGLIFFTLCFTIFYVSMKGGDDPPSSTGRRAGQPSSVKKLSGVEEEPDQEPDEPKESVAASGEAASDSLRQRAAKK